MKSKNLILIILTLACAGIQLISVHATNSYDMSSQGKIIFDNGTEDVADDVVFDATDFIKLAQKCQ